MWEDQTPSIRKARWRCSRTTPRPRPGRPRPQSDPLKAPAWRALCSSPASCGCSGSNRTARATPITGRASGACSRAGATSSSGRSTRSGSSPSTSRRWPCGFKAISAKVLGYGGLSVLLPQALMGVASVVLTYHLVRRVFGAGAGLLAGLALAVTPICVAIDRDNLPDTALVLALLLATWALSRAAESGRLGPSCWRWRWSAWRSTSRCWPPSWYCRRSSWPTGWPPRSAGRRNWPGWRPRAWCWWRPRCRGRSPSS